MLGATYLASAVSVKSLLNRPREIEEKSEEKDFAAVINFSQHFQEACVTKLFTVVTNIN